MIKELVKKLARFIDERGELVPVEFSTLPFIPQRAFYVQNVPCGIIRGGHAHHQTQQYLICVRGQIVVTLFDGVNTQKITLGEGDCVFVDKLVWDEQEFFTSNSVLLVLANTPYDKEDYITDKDKFLDIIKRIGNA